MIKWYYDNRRKLELELLKLDEKEHYEQDISKSERELLEMFFELNQKNTTKQNIINFFELLGELINYANNSEVKNGRVQD